MNTTAALVKHKRALADKAAKRAADIAEQRRREARQRGRAEKRRKYLGEKAVQYQHFLQLTALLAHLESDVNPDGTGPFELITKELKMEVDALRQTFSRSDIETEMLDRDLYSDSDEEFWPRSDRAEPASALPNPDINNQP